MTARPLALAALAALALVPALADAQTPEADGVAGGVAVFRYVPVGRPSMAVDVWGGVGQPGRYVVEAGRTLLDVLVLAGGPALGADDLAARTATVTVARGAGPDRAVAARLTLADLADGAPVPELRDGDLVVVRTAGAGRVALSVDVWGAVGQPGRYDVAPGAGLLDVLTLAGGPRFATDQDDRSQAVRVTLSRAAGAGRAVVYEGTAEALAAGAAPALEAGDLVTVRLEQRARFGWRDAISVATASASLVLLVLRINDLAQ